MNTGTGLNFSAQDFKTFATTAMNSTYEMPLDDDRNSIEGSKESTPIDVQNMNTERYESNNLNQLRKVIGRVNSQENVQISKKFHQTVNSLTLKRDIEADVLHTENF